jgi:galactonate dehydratase
MKIAEVESLLLNGAHFVRITTENGLVGLGQSACWAYPSAVDAVVRTFRDYLLGQDARQIERHWQHLYRMGPFRGSVLSGAISAVDIALWDIMGKALKQPIYQLLGGAFRTRVQAYATGLFRRERADRTAAQKKVSPRSSSIRCPRATGT